ncbi:TRAP transporter small permease subunit [Pseudarthrobacter siccitolerans]
MTTLDEQPERFPWLRWVDRLSVGLAVLGGIATVAMMLNVVVDVIGRSFFSRPFAGTIELTQFAWMPTLVSLGMGLALLRGEHIRVNLLTGPTKQRTQRVIEIVGMSLTLCIAALLAWYGGEKAAEAMTIGERAVGVTWLDIWPFRWLIVVGMVGLLLQASAQLVRAITVEVFQPSDDADVAAAIEDEETVLDELAHEDAGSGPVYGRPSKATKR